MKLDRERGVYKFDCWVVPYRMVQSGNIEFEDTNGTKKTVGVDRKASFSGQS